MTGWSAVSSKWARAGSLWSIWTWESTLIPAWPAHRLLRKSLTLSRRQHMQAGASLRYWLRSCNYHSTRTTFAWPWHVQPWAWEYSAPSCQCIPLETGHIFGINQCLLIPWYSTILAITWTAISSDNRLQSVLTIKESDCCMLEWFSLYVL